MVLWLLAGGRYNFPVVFRWSRHIGGMLLFAVMSGCVSYYCAVWAGSGGVICCCAFWAMTGSVTILCNGRFLVVSYYGTICAGSDRVMYYCVIWARTDSVICYWAVYAVFGGVVYYWQCGLCLVVSFIAGCIVQSFGVMQCGLFWVVSLVTVRCGLFRVASFIAVQCRLFWVVSFVTVQCELHWTESGSVICYCAVWAVFWRRHLLQCSVR